MWAVFDALGGHDALLQWAKENPTEFYLGMFRQLIPKAGERAAENERAQPLVLNAVAVNNPEEALNALERMYDDRNGLGGAGRSSDELQMDEPLPPHTIHLQQADEGGAGPAEAADTADATASREDDAGGERAAVPLPDAVSASGSDVRNALQRLGCGAGRVGAELGDGVRPVVRLLGEPDEPCEE